MDSSDSECLCPLCCEELDISDRNFFPCKCGYQVCMWCWHRIRETESGLCPACRTPYGDDPHAFSAVDVEEVLKANKEKEAAAKREKERSRQHQNDASNTNEAETITSLLSGNLRGQMEIPKDRTQLANIRVIRRDLVYAVGLPPSIANEDILRRPEYFGQYGKIAKIVLNRSQITGNGDPRRASASAYVTFVHKEDTLACILALDGFYLDNRNIRASYGTSKYCSAFIKNVRCNNPDCTYLHQMGDIEDTFTKQEIQAGYVTSGRDVLARQQQIMAQTLSSSNGSVPPRRKAGGGGPSGTGRSSANPVFPAPTYDEQPPRSSIAGLVPPPSVSSTGRSVTSGTGFPPILGGGGSITSSVPVPKSGMPRSSSVGGIPSTVSAEGNGVPKAASKVAAAPTAKTSRKSTSIISEITSSSTGPPPVAPSTTSSHITTAASVVASGRGSLSASEQPSTHTTLTPLTPLKRSAGTKTGKPIIAIDESAAPDVNLNNAKSASRSGHARETMAHVSKQRPEPENGVISQIEKRGPNSSLVGTFLKPATDFEAPTLSDYEKSSVSSIGGSIIAAPSVAGIGPLGGSVAGIPGGNSLPMGRPPNDSGGDGLGGLGGEVFDGPLKSSKNDLIFGSTIGGGGGGGDKWNSSVIGRGAAFSSDLASLWGDSKSTEFPVHRSSSNNFSSDIQSNHGSIASGGIGSRSSNAHSSGSSALASMLGINLPTGSGSLRESSNLWGSPGQLFPSNGQSSSAPVPMQGIIGPSNTQSNNGTIGGSDIIGRQNATNPGTMGNRGNQSDIALLQSLLPGVHITSGSSHQPLDVFGSGGNWNGASGATFPSQQTNSSGLGLSERNPGGHLNAHHLIGNPAGAIGQKGTKQHQQSAPGSIW